MQPPETFHDTRPWGEELWLTRGTSVPSMVKIIKVNPGEALSLQLHKNRDEFWSIVSGDGKAQIGDQEVALQSGSSCFVPRETKHRIYGGTTTLVFVELAFGDFSEEDIVRFEDKYNRVTK